MKIKKTILRKTAEKSLYPLLVAGGLYLVALCGKDNEGLNLSYFSNKTQRGFGLCLDNRGLELFLDGKKFENYVSRYGRTK